MKPKEEDSANQESEKYHYDNKELEESNNSNDTPVIFLRETRYYITDMLFTPIDNFNSGSNLNRKLSVSGDKRNG